MAPELRIPGPPGDAQSHVPVDMSHLVESRPSGCGRDATMTCRLEPGPRAGCAAANGPAQTAVTTAVAAVAAAAASAAAASAAVVLGPFRGS